MSFKSIESSESTGFNWALFAAGAACGFFAGWAKRLVFAVVGQKKK